MRLLLIILSCLLGMSQARAEVITAKSWIIADQSGRILQGQDMDTVRPIASISKLLTVMIVLDAKQSLSDMMNLSDHGYDHLPTNEPYTRRSLIALALIRSDNRAAFTLCEQYPGGYDACIAAMNAKARALGMLSTSMSDPTGLDVRNTSTARDLVLLTVAARSYPLVVWAAGNKDVEVLTYRNHYRFHNTDPLVGRRDDIVVSKTGFTNPAGGCIVIGTKTRTVVLLASKSVHTRIPEANALLDLPISQGF